MLKLPDIKALNSYARAMGHFFPRNCGNLLVSGQYALPLKILTRYLKPNSHVLDWGCGGGHFSFLLQQCHYAVTSYAYESVAKSPLSEWIASAKNWTLTQSDKKDPIKLPYSDHVFDGVISLGVLEHVTETGGNERGSIQEFYRILKPGGFFFCFHFPNYLSWIEACARTLQKLKIKKFCHLNLYTKKEILKLLDETNFRLLDLGKYNLFPRSMLRLLPGNLGWSRNVFYTYAILEKMCWPLLGTCAQNYYFVCQK